MKKSSVLNPTIMIFVVVLLAGCAATKAPLYQSELFNNAKIDHILILPTADLRLNTEKRLLKLDKWVHKTVEYNLKKKKYSYGFVTDRNIVESITEDDLSDIEANWIKELYPSGERWILLVALLDSRSKLTLGSTGNAEVSSYLFDMADGSVLWRDKGIGKVGQGGLIGMAMKGAMEGDAIKIATSQSLVSLPKKK